MVASVGVKLIPSPLFVRPFCEKVKYLCIKLSCFTVMLVLGLGKYFRHKIIASSPYFLKEKQDVSWQHHL